MVAPWSQTTASGRIRRQSCTGSCGLALQLDSHLLLMLHLLVMMHLLLCLLRRRVLLLLILLV